MNPRLLLGITRALFTTNSSGGGHVVINEVLPQAADGRGEWIELYNPTVAPTDLSGWSLKDRADNVLGSLAGKVLSSGDYTVVHFSSKLNNDGDAVTLYDSTGRIVDTFQYASAVPGKSFARIPSGGQWAAEPHDPTEGAPNGPCDSRSVIMNEVLPSPLSGDEWVELYNVGCIDVDLSGWRLVDAAGYAKTWDGTIIAARSYLIASFRSKLNNGGDSLSLFNASGTVVDSFTYTSSSPGRSWRRAPGGGPWYPEPGMPSHGDANPVETTLPPTTTAPPPAPGPPGGPPPCGGRCGGICFGTWNIQNLGAAKGGRPAVMAVIRQVLSRYDVAGIQELSQMPREPFAWCGENTKDVICDSIPDAATFAVRASPRIGDEQYVVMYKKASAEILDSGKTYPDPNNVHSRPPHAFEVRTKLGGAGRLVVGVTHTSPERATEEIHNFPQVTAWMESEFSGAQHFLLAGDFNADGSYFSDEREWPHSQLQPEWAANYEQLTDNSMDTTVFSNDNTYDRIVVDNGLGNMSGHARVYYLENVDMTGVYQEGCRMGYVSSTLCAQDGLAGAAWQDFPQSAKTALAKEISDHHPVEVCLGPQSGPSATRPRSAVLLVSHSGKAVRRPAGLLAFWFAALLSFAGAPGGGWRN